MEARKKRARNQATRDLGSYALKGFRLPRASEARINIGAFDRPCSENHAVVIITTAEIKNQQNGHFSFAIQFILAK